MKMYFREHGPRPFWQRPYLYTRQPNSVFDNTELGRRERIPPQQSDSRIIGCDGEPIEEEED